MDSNDPLSAEEALFERALALPSGEAREAFLLGACGDNASLRQRIDRLLAAHQQAGAFMKTQDGEDAAALPGTPLTEGPGTKIGRYKLLQQIGEGGMGVVYMAEQEEPVRRRVALKIVKLGMDTRSVVARFEAERQALALMDHPNIARVLDGGATETGRPYFVMELVQGVPITEFCDRNRLVAKARLDLFVQVCQAIQSAHQKGIIHRDIKPSNVLVTLHHGEPMPKVIDFGIAKATNQRLTEKTLFTRHATLIGTPAYMSPEQAEISSLDVDTRADIYSLGVMLYELLAGSTPFPESRLRSLAYGEMQRVIREEEPEKPSTRLSTLDDAQKDAVARHRDVELTSLSRLLRGDLDWIVMKCLEKNRTRRYETATSLAEDLQRYARDEPVTARPPTAGYRLKKALHRHRGVFAATAAVGLTLSIGIGLSLWQSVARTRAYRLVRAAELREKGLREQAEASQRKAAEEAAIAKAVTDFFRLHVFGATRTTSNEGDAAARAPQDVTVAEALDAAAEAVEDAFVDQPRTEAAIRYSIGQSYMALGNPLAAIPQLSRALDLRRPRLDFEDAATVGNLAGLAACYQQVGRAQAAIPLCEELATFARGAWTTDDPRLATALFHLGKAYGATGRYQDAVGPLDESIRLETQAGREKETASVYAELALAHGWLHHPDLCISLLEKALRLSETARGSDDQNTLTIRHNLAVAYLSFGRETQAIAVFEEVLEASRKRLGDTHPDTLETRNRLAELYQKAGRRAEAATLLRENARASDLPKHRNPLVRLKSLTTLGTFLIQHHQPSEAEPIWADSLQTAREVLKAGPDSLEAVRSALGDLPYRLGRTDQLDRLWSEGLEQDNDPERRARLWHARAEVRARTRRWGDAIRDLQEAIRVQPLRHELHHELLPLLVQVEDREGYQRARSEALRLFDGTRDHVIAERMAKDCSLLPFGGEEGDKVLALAQYAAGASDDHAFRTYFRHAKALALYRHGEFKEALAWADKVREERGQDSLRDAQCLALTALTRHRLNDHAGAQSALEELRRAIDTLTRSWSEFLPGSFGDWIIARTLCREAEDVLQAGQIPPGAPLP